METLRAVVPHVFVVTVEGILQVETEGRFLPTVAEVGVGDHIVAELAGGVVGGEIVVALAHHGDRECERFRQLDVGAGLEREAGDVIDLLPAERGVGGGQRGGEERDGFFAAYVPGNTSSIFPPGFAKKIPAGTTLSFQMHYTPNGKATIDQTKLGLIFSPAPPQHVIQVAGLANPRLNIPPGNAHHPETTAITLPAAVTLLSFTPHMHVRGKAARYEAVLPDGTRRRLLDVPAYDFNWQLQYRLAEPLSLPRGTRLVYTAWYDNSTGNPANPDPTKTVRWGPQTFDEMMLGYVEYFVPERGTLAQSPL